MTKLYSRPVWVDEQRDLPEGLSMKHLEEEKFVSIDGLDKYAVSSYGTVINVNTGQELKQHTDKDGRKRVTLRRYVDGKVKKYTIFVHRYVAMAFFANYEPGVEVLHKNGIYGDNTVFNLTLGGPCRDGDDLREALF